MTSLTILLVVGFCLLLSVFAWNVGHKDEYSPTPDSVQLIVTVERTGSDFGYVLDGRHYPRLVAPTRTITFYTQGVNDLLETDPSGDSAQTVGWASCSSCVRGYDEIGFWQTASGYLDGWETDGSASATIKHRSRWFKISGLTPFTKKIRFRVYHVDGSAVETHLGTVTRSMITADGVYANYSQAVTLAAATFGPNDRILIRSEGQLSRAL